jgi:hypothetical protein
MDKKIKMKFKGCNHPTRLLNRPQKQSPDQPASLSRSRRRFGTSMTSLDQEPHISESSRNSSSMTQLPTIKARPANHRQQSRSSLHDGLPPVPGSSGSDSSSINMKRPPLNLVALGRQQKNEQRKSSLSKLKQSVMISTPMFMKMSSSSSQLRSEGKRRTK